MQRIEISLNGFLVRIEVLPAPAVPNPVQEVAVAPAEAAQVEEDAESVAESVAEDAESATESVAEEEQVEEDAASVAAQVEEGTHDNHAMEEDAMQVEDEIQPAPPALAAFPFPPPILIPPFFFGPPGGSPASLAF